MVLRRKFAGVLQSKCQSNGDMHTLKKEGIQFSLGICPSFPLGLACKLETQELKKKKKEDQKNILTIGNLN